MCRYRYFQIADIVEGAYLQSETKMQPCGHVTGKGGEIILYMA